MKKIFATLFFTMLLNLSWAQLFKEVSNEIGLDYYFPGIGNQVVGAGITVIDINNDGWEDLFQSGGVFASKLWINQKGKFVDKSKEYGLEVLDKYFVQSAVAADFNNDGFEDLFLSNFGAAKFGGDHLSPLLLMNEGGKKLVPVCRDRINIPGNYSAASWGDYNLDGFVDIYLANYIGIMNHSYDTITLKHGYEPHCMGNKFYKNINGTVFVDETNRLNLGDEGCGLATTFSDFDHDGDPDLLLLNDFGAWNHMGNLLYRNEFPQDSFTEISKSIGFYKEIYGMGIGPGDFDQDGDLDYYITNIGENYLFRNDAGKFRNVALDLGIDSKMVNDSLYSTSWSGLFFDYDNDADLDLYLNKGNTLAITPKTAVLDPNKIFIHQDGKFMDLSKGSGIDDSLSHRGAAMLDFDHDGDLDIVSTVLKLPWALYGGMDQKIKFYKNLNKSKNKWIAIQLIGDGKVNRSCIGCSVTLNDGKTTMIKEISAGTGHGSQSTRMLYFGLGKRKKAVNLTIRWTDGQKDQITIKKFNSLYAIRVGGSSNKLKY
jgi:hypothetical protein